MLAVLGVAITLAALVLSVSVAAQPGVGLGAVKILSDEVSVRRWTVEQGLPQSTVTRLATDERGYLWGTTFGGLFRFDGRSIAPFTSSEIAILDNNSVTAIQADGEYLWIGTPSGTVAKLYGDSLVDSLPHPPRDQTSSVIDNLLVAGPGDVWIREGRDVHRFLGGRWGPPLTHPGLSNFVRDRQGALFYLGPHGLVRIDRVGARIVARPDTGRTLGQMALHADARDHIWMGLESGLWVLEGRVLRHLYRDSVHISAIVSDSTGAVWFAAGRQLLRLRSVDATAGSRAPRPGGGPPSVQAMLDAGAGIVSLTILRDGLLAVGTHEGLLIVRSNPSRVVRLRPALPATEVGSLVSRGDGTLYVTSGCSDIYRVDLAGRLLDSVPRPKAVFCTKSLLLDHQGMLWAGGEGAIRRRYAGTGQAAGPATRDTVFTIQSFLGSPPAVSAMMEVDDAIVFGLSDGRVGRIRRAGFVDFLPGWTVPTDAAIHSMAHAPDGAIWVAQTGMLARVFRGEPVYYHALHGIPNAIPRALLADARGGVWIGTYGSGLWYFRPGGRARRVPLPDPTVSAIMVDAIDRLWMSGNRGISVVPRTALYQWLADSAEAPGARLLSYADGVPEGNIGHPAAAQVGPGLFAFASVSGIVEVNTDAVLTTGITPPVRIDSLRGGNGARFQPGSRVVLLPDDRVLQVGLSAPTYRFAEAIRFRFRVDGRDKEWVSLGAQRELRVAGLRPGSYTLHVEGKVPGGEWRAAEPIQIDVVPVFSEQTWPRVAAVVVVLLLVAVSAIQRVRATQATARATEIELRARRDAAELAERHQREMAQVSRVAVAGELTASLSHELGQPLAAIVNNAEVARRLVARGDHAANASPVVEQALLDVVAQGRRASQVVREFRRFLKREGGERELLAVRELLDGTALLLRQEFEQSGVLLELRIRPDTPRVLAERVLLQQVLVNLMHNAHDAARRAPGGRVLVRVRPVAGGVRLTVVDSGPGFAPDVRRSAFEPFVTTRRDGMGMGLAIAKRIVESHGGHIAVGRLPSAGAVVSMWLPVQHIPDKYSDSLIPLQVTEDGRRSA